MSDERLSDEIIADYAKKTVWPNHTGRMARELIAARAELAELRQAVPFVQHKPGCPADEPLGDGKLCECICGYDKLPARARWEGT